MILFLFVLLALFIFVGIFSFPKLKDAPVVDYEEKYDLLVAGISQALLAYELSGEASHWEAVRRANPKAIRSVADVMAEDLLATLDKVGEAYYG